MTVFLLLWTIVPISVLSPMASTASCSSPTSVTMSPPSCSPMTQAYRPARCDLGPCMRCLIGRPVACRDDTGEPKPPGDDPRARRIEHAVDQHAGLAHRAAAAGTEAPVDLVRAIPDAASVSLRGSPRPRPPASTRAGQLR
jgi:hypothetical protein